MLQNAYVCDGTNSRIIKVNLDGKILGLMGSFGKIPGKIHTPHYMPWTAGEPSMRRISATGASTSL